MCCKMFHRNLLIIALLLLSMLIVGCSTLEKVVYRPDMNQGNYLSHHDVEKIEKGMTQQQVAYILGTPMLRDPFGSRTWFYVFRQQTGHEKITQRTLTLLFDADGALINIEK
ncbi:outer membrane protein assembly factor BamE [Candidatus Regiella insecticola]|nr:outer membrane protein assembly factor BamE [Candidatus Regiella insecticola]